VRRPVNNSYRSFGRNPNAEFGVNVIRESSMRLVSRLLLRAVVASVSLTASAFQTEAQTQAEPKITIRCGPVRNVILKQVAPEYPSEARTKGIEGIVRITVLVNKDGVPEKLRVLNGRPELVNASLDAVKQWRYKPYKLNGKAVPVETSIDIKYVIPPKTRVTGREEH
jgi:TonB family protein